MPRRLPLTLIPIFTLWTGIAHADSIRLANGDELSGEVVEWAVDYVVIDHPQLGRLRLSLDQLELDTGKPPPKGLFGTDFLRGWKRNLDVGWTGRSGSTDNLNITAGLNLSYADEFRRWKLTGRYYYNDSSDGDTDNNARVDLRRDWLFPGHDWFAFGSARYQYDQFEAWKHRTVLSLGPGYNLLTGETHKLDVRAGPTFTREYSGNRKSAGEMLVGFDYDWKISERSSLHLSNDFYVEWEPSAGDIRNLTVGEWKLALTEDPVLSLKIGGSNEYDTNPDEGDEPNDLRYYLALGLDF